LSDTTKSRKAVHEETRLEATAKEAANVVQKSRELQAVTVMWVTVVIGVDLTGILGGRMVGLTTKVLL